ncbi:coagulation factor V [Trematomus bernacchii]|uniref:coagulation factor V n=1 Tax=Trematomus bernacchii TaxID=40690 RepID=UPI00146BE3E3|nr:coagulation factor V [Trematomus bernacchii]
MRLCLWVGARGFLPVLVLLTVLHVNAVQPTAKERHYYIAAVEIDWDYAENDPHRFGPTYKKVVFREYDKGFRQAKTHPSWLGLLGPTLRAQEGETIVVTFRNMASGPHSIHPHGVAYGKQSEGANYFDNTSQKEKEDDVVQPNSEHVYYWEVTPDVSPQPSDSPCLTYSYVSHKDVVQDYNSGLIGALLICKPGSLDESGIQIGVEHEYVFLFGVFDERESKYTPKIHANHVKYTINGYAMGTLPDVSVCAHASVSLHLLAMSSDPEVFSVHLNGQVLQHNGHKVSSVGLISGSTASCSMVALHRGRWMLSSHTMKHMEVGMHGFLEVKKCDGFSVPNRRMTIEQKRHSKVWKYYIAAEEIIWDYAPSMPEYVDEDFKLQYLKQSASRIGRKYKKAVYTLYTNESFTERLETKQRKNELGILGPVIKAQIRDVIKIVFKNLASRPYSIYPHGLTIEKSDEGVNYPAGGNQSHGVQPGETHTYVWRVVDEDEPLDGDSRCLTRLYHSAVDAPRDIASGLIGQILICKSRSLNVRGVQLKADKEQHAMLAVFDENKSWYLDDNIRQFCDRSKVNKADPEFIKSNVMHSINGYVFESGPHLGFCNGEIATWHMSSIGAQDYIQTATFYGHTFEVNGRTEDFLSLYPMTGETITMEMDNLGVWLLASLNSHETTKGMRVKFKDVECYRDNEYDYPGYDYKNTFHIWNPQGLPEIKNEEEKPNPAVENKPVKIDIDTDMYAELWDLRSLKNQSKDPGVDQLDLSFLDYDAVDVPEDGNVMIHFKGTKNKTQTSFSKPNANWKDVDGSNLTEVDLYNQSIKVNTSQMQNSSTLGNSSLYKIENTTILYSPNLLKSDNATINTSASADSHTNNTTVQNATVLSADGDVSIKPNAINETLLSNLEKVDGFNLTDVHLLNQSISENTTQSQNSSQPSTFGDSSLNNKIENTTVLYSPNIVLKNDNLTTNSSASAVSDTNNTTVHNVTVLSADVPTDITNLTVTLTGNASSILETEELNVTLTSDNQTTDSEEILTRGDVFSYSVPTSNSSVKNLSNSTDGNATSLSNSAEKVDENNIAANVSADDDSLSFPAADVEKVSMDISNLTILELEVDGTDNKTNGNDTTEEPEYTLQMNSSENVTIEADSSLGNVSQALLESKQNISRSNTTESNVTSLLDESNYTSSAESFSNKSNVSLSGDAGKESQSEELSVSEESEELLIYLTGNHSQVIKTTPVKTQSHNWTYESTHQMEPVDIPDYMMKYFPKETPKATPPPKKIRKVSLRQRPPKGLGMKTKKKKEYKPQSRSGLPLSPRGFGPAMTPRGSRPVLQPVTDEEELINEPVVIGVPRSDFSDYELYVPGDDPDHLAMEGDVTADEYEYVTYVDPYSGGTDIKILNLDDTTKYYLKFSGPNVRTYFIAAEEVNWDYGGYGQRRQDKSEQNSRETKFTKVVFRGYMDSSFSTPDIRGEMDEHLGILGPVIKAEVGQSIMVVFMNKASRPYSLHPNGVTYTKQTEGLSYEDGSEYWYKYDNEVQPNTTFTYIWKVNSKVGPMPTESHCRTWAYYSGVNPERDIHSGLIGPLLVCREGTLEKNIPDMREFTLLFMTFDESQSWYYNENQEMMQRKSKRRYTGQNNKSLQFHSINGIIFNLKGLRMYTNRLVSWYLINMGSPKDFQSINFHGQTFIHKKISSYRQSVYPLLPGSFATLEMYPSKPGLWQLETEIGFNQQKGMQTLFLVLDNDCHRALGLESGSVKDNQITAINTRGYWEPNLARLNNGGKYNAWSTEQNMSWIQVDFQRPVVISQVATQGAKQMLQHQFVTKYSISYSTDRKKWIFYKGDSRDLRKVFPGNEEAYVTKGNTFFPPVIARFIRLHPINWYNKATVRMEFYGCELDGCSVPLGMKSRLIEDRRITASSEAYSWYSGYSWKPAYARLDKQGTINAWQAKYSNMNQWLQVELPQVKKITGIVTQGAKSLGKEMYVISYSLQYSDNGIHWTPYTDDEAITCKTFLGNTDNSDHVKNYIYPPIFSRFIRVIPRSWMTSITMRIELLGCDFE